MVDVVVATVPLVGVLLTVDIVLPLVDGLASALRSSTDALGLNLAPLIFGALRSSTDELGLNLAPLILGGLSEVADEGVRRPFGDDIAEDGVGICGDSGLCEP